MLHERMADDDDLVQGQTISSCERPHATSSSRAGLTDAGPSSGAVGPAPATEKLLARLGLATGDFDVIELNEAFASQALAVLRRLGLPDDAAQVNPNGGAIALGHPLGGTGATLMTKAVHELVRGRGRYGLVTMCCGGGLGTGTMIERL